MNYFKWLSTRWYFYVMVFVYLIGFISYTGLENMIDVNDYYYTAGGFFGSIAGSLIINGVILSFVWVFVRKKYREIKIENGE